jgi:hypothetical protein
MAKAMYLGIVKNGESLLTTIAFDENDAKRAATARREAEQSLYGWQDVFPTDRLSIERLSSRSAKGWEIAK